MELEISVPASNVQDVVNDVIGIKKGAIDHI